MLATVKFPMNGKGKDIVATLTDGSTTKVYPQTEAAAQELRGLSRGQQIELGRDESGEWQFIRVASRDDVLGQYIQQMGNLYSRAYQQAIASLPKDCDSETIRCCASSIFISIQRHFNL
ncbi:MAG: hypothetical protein HC835_11385 [Oscillatoriales cyanobacterium RM2_1_1]|nr:hypothetical protein [Oscillatoriales cyanobacterium SM2_3_0]NJO46178.1 hypothetical protein [Oscillatoriales cyanobacterium RM2_1_1]